MVRLLPASHPWATRVRARCPLPGCGTGGERSFDEAIDVVAGGKAGGLVATGLVD